MIKTEKFFSIKNIENIRNKNNITSANVLKYFFDMVNSQDKNFVKFNAVLSEANLDKTGKEKLNVILRSKGIN